MLEVSHVRRKQGQSILNSAAKYIVRKFRDTIMDENQYVRKLRVTKIIIFAKKRVSETLECPKLTCRVITGFQYLILPATSELSPVSQIGLERQQFTKI